MSKLLKFLEQGAVENFFFFDKAKFNYSLSSKLRNINAFNCCLFLVLHAAFKTVILTGLSLSSEMKRNFVFFASKSEIQSTIELLFKSSRAHLSLLVEDRIRLILLYFNIAQVLTDENATLSHSKVQLSTTVLLKYTFERDKLSVGRTPFYLIYSFPAVI